MGIQSEMAVCLLQTYNARNNPPIGFKVFNQMTLWVKGLRRIKTVRWQLKISFASFSAICVARKCAQDRNRTCTTYRSLPPQSSASTSSATWAYCSTLTITNANIFRRDSKYSQFLYFHIGGKRFSCKYSFVPKKEL